MKKATPGDTYRYCPACDSIRYSRELEETEDGLKCSVCGCADLLEPGWVQCPQIGNVSVKCPVAGAGIVTEGSRTYCNVYCSFRR